MRIIAGVLGGRQFASPRGHRTHPMSDKIRGALFNALGDIDGLTVLDAYAGSGALSFEAVSRGAASALAIDSDVNAQRVIAENIQSLRLRQSVKLVRAAVSAWLSTSDQEFDIVLADPPYDNVSLENVQKLAERTKRGGIFVVSLPPTILPSLEGDYDRVLTKNYGDAQLLFYRRLA